ncbi:MAG: HD domain-containing protein [Methanomassiliicoccales archaeon]|nr:HD domain-containing protein [Methanomassiliicoccales archaeon]
MPDFKVIHDSVHGSVKVEGVFLELLGRPEVQRLHGIHQLGLAYLVFPGAHHTRLEHSLGTFHIATRMASALGLDEDESELVRAAALVHDVGHAPFSHSLEEVMAEKLDVDHMLVGRELILGEKRCLSATEKKALSDTRTIREVLDANGIDPEEVAEIVVSPRSQQQSDQRLLDVEKGQAHFSHRTYLSQMIHGPVDVDQMDYLLRDAHYTGVAHGAIDLARLMQTVAVHHGDLVVDRRGVTAVEGLIVARALMYSSVYFHKTVRIAEMMLCKAVEMSDRKTLENLHKENDGSLTEKLTAQGGYPARLMLRLKYRELYKRAFSIAMTDLDEAAEKRLADLSEYSKRKAMEEDIAARAGVHVSEVIIDMPERELLISEPRIDKTEVRILEDDRIRPLSRYSPLAKALQSRSVFEWAVMVSCPKEKREEVARAASRALGT